MTLSYSSFKARISLAIFYIYILVFVLSNSLLVENYTALLPNQISYWFKHAIIVIAAFFSLIFYTKNSIISLLLFSVIILIYFIGGQYLFTLMIICFAISSPLIGASIKHLLLFNGIKSLLFLLFVALIPLLFNLFIGNLYPLFNSHYGRGRLLLGYTHPKEAAAPFLMILILIFIKYREFRNYVFWCGVLLLLLISSRNAFLYFLLFVFFTSKVKFKAFWISLIFIFIVFIFLFSFSNAFELINTLSSKRFDAWSNYLSLNESGGYDGIKADNFILEIYLMVGGFGVVAYLIWWFGIIIYQKGYNAILYKSSLKFTPILCLFFYSLIDTGFASSGNLVHVFSWGLYFSNLKFKNDL
jgi:hypothetical protein